MLFRPLQVLLIIVVLLALYGMRIYLLPEGGLPDYDTVQNWKVAQEIASGNFTNLFYHRSPLFNLFYGGLSLFIYPLKSLILVNAALNVLAVFLLCRLVLHYRKLSALQFAALLLVAGSSLFMVHTSRYLTVESAGLPVFALFLSNYLKRSESNNLKFWYRAVFWLAIGIGINYKFALLLPVLLVLELLQLQKVVSTRVFLKSIGILLAPALVLSLIGVLAGLPWYRYMATYAGITRFSVPNAAMRTGKFQSDLSFYFRYLWEFESPLAWLSLVLYFMVFKPWHYLRRQNLTLPDVLAVLCICFLAGMSVLLKAPRGLVFVYVPLYILGFLCLLKAASGRKMYFALALVLSFSFSCWKMYDSVYRYSQTNYPEMATAIGNSGIKNVVQTVGNGLAPFGAENGFEVIPVSRPQEFREAVKKRPAWVLTDTYYLTTNIQFFDSLQQMPAVLKLTSPALLSPMFFLEHAEFTGLGYTETMKLRQQAIEKSAQLRLIKLPQ